MPVPLIFWAPRRARREAPRPLLQAALWGDVTAGPRHPEWGYGYTAALINFAFLAHAVLTTDEVVKAMK